MIRKNGLDLFLIESSYKRLLFVPLGNGLIADFKAVAVAVNV